MRHGPGATRTIRSSRTLPLASDLGDEFGDEPATELMEMPSEAPVALVELGEGDLEPCEDEPTRHTDRLRGADRLRPAPTRPEPARAEPVPLAKPPSGRSVPQERTPRPFRAVGAVTAPPAPPRARGAVDMPAPLPVLFGGRPAPGRPAPRPEPPPPDASRGRWLASAIAMASAWGVLMLLGVCLVLAVLARTAV